MRLIYICVLMLLPLLAFSQEEAFYIELKDENLTEAFTKIEDIYNVLFSYKDDYVTHKRISIDRKERTLLEVLDAIKELTKLNYKVLNNRYIIISQSLEENAEVNELDRVVVHSYLTKGIEKNRDGSYQLSPSKLGILPGLTESDVLESIQLLPGVLSPNETASGFSVRGGAADQNRLIWNGINIYHKGHLFGMISPLNPNVTSKIKFINKGSHARYGERVSSVTDIYSKSDISNKAKAEIGANGVNADVVLDIPIIENKMSIQGSIRRSYVNALETNTFKQLSAKVFENTKISEEENGDNNFSFIDYNIKLNYKLNTSNSFYASIISIDNKLDYISMEEESSRSFSDRLNIRNDGYGVGWNIKWSDNISQTTKAFLSDYKFNYSFVTSVDEEQVSDFEKRNTIFDSGISSEVTVNTSKEYNYVFGYQYNLKDVAYAFLNTTGLGFILDTEESIIETHSAYGSLDYRNEKLFDITLGLRSTYFKELDAIRFEPRLILYKSLNTHFKLQASGEVKNQIISEIDETVHSDLSLENRVWRLADGNKFPIINSKHTSLGFLYSNNNFSFDVDAYYKKIKNVTALSLGFLNPENNTFNVGNQKTYGVDVFMKKRFNGFNSWISYSFNNARSNFEDINNGEKFKSKSNVTHAISTALSYKNNGFKVALGWKWQTGRPYTLAYKGENGLEFNKGVNTAQLPVYHRLDLSSTYSFKLSKQNRLRGKVGISIRNLYGRKNLISREYRGNNSLNDPIELIKRYSIGFTPNFMFRLYW